ncbi:MAG: hypothetical protein NC218_04045 [Acetobacter sp.]|nr:hypothetical protein [Acetobacter sp.]
MTKNQNNRVQAVVNSFLDRGEGVVEFPNGLTITDDSVMWSGWKYDIDTLDISEYPGQVTANHIDMLENVLGKVEGVKKEGNRVYVERIRYAIKENALAKLAYDLLVGGFSNQFSIETMPTGNDDYENGVFHSHKLVGLSQVVMGNNKHAHVNSVGEMALVTNSINASKEAGLDTSVVEHILDNEEEQAVATNQAEPKEVKEEVIANTAEEVSTPEVKPEKEAVEASEAQANAEAESKETVAEANDADTEAPEAEEVAEDAKEENDAEAETSDEEIVKSESEEEVETEDNQAEATEADEEEVQTQADAEDQEVAEDATETDTEANQAETKTEEEPTEEPEQAPAEQPAEEEADDIKEENMADLQKLVDEAVAKKLNAIAEAQAAEANEPEFEKSAAPETKVDNNYRARYEKQVKAIVNIAKTHSIKAQNELEEINQFNFNALVEAGKVSNTMTIEEFGNFVLPPEMYDEIVGVRTNYDAFLAILDWRETDRLEFSWLRRDGDIKMQPVAMCAPQNPSPITDASVDADDSNVKKLTQYGAHAVFEQLEEIAGVTPICNAARLFLAVDLVADAIRGYRNDFAFGKASLAIAKFQQAVAEAETGIVYAYGGSDLESIKKFLEVLAAISDSTTNGRFIFTQRTLLKIKGFALGAGVNGPLGEIFINGSVPTIFGVPYTIVPNDLMPSIGDDVANNPKFLVNGEEVEITSTVFFGDTDQFIGYTRGGLNLDISDVASYGPNAQYSAYQRDEIVLRGYYYRGGAFRLPEAMAAIMNKAATKPAGS